VITTLTALDEVLEARAFERLVGSVETAWFDAKDQPYAASDAGKRALGKDVTAFANAAGGVILVGFRTKPSTNHYGDEIIEVRPFDATLVDTDQYRKIVNDWVFPAIQHVEIAWLPTLSDETRGIVMIRVPPQASEMKPFLVTKFVDGSKIVETIFGYSERRGDANEPLRVAELQRALRIGMNYERILDGRLASIEARLAGPQPDNDGPTQKLPERLEGLISGSDFADDRAFMLSGYPKSTVAVEGIFTNDPGSIRRQLERPPILRQSGWDFANLGQSIILRGESIRIDGFRRSVTLYRDGTFIVGCSASDAFLAWTSSAQRLHPTAVVEFTYNFAAFYELVLKTLRPVPETIVLRIDVRNFCKDGQATILGSGTLQSLGQVMPELIRRAPDDHASLQVDFATTSFDPATASFALLREFYLWFGLEETKIPYIKKLDDRKVVDIGAISRS